VLLGEAEKANRLLDALEASRGVAA
jgi:hypothetical protein